jgi:hypothetical protein
MLCIIKQDLNAVYPEKLNRVFQVSKGTLVLVKQKKDIESGVLVECYDNNLEEFNKHLMRYYGHYFEDFFEVISESE